MAKITVKDTEVTITKVNDEDYLCLTDMLKAKDGEFFITDWLRNRNTLEYLGIWEKIHNPEFNYGEFATIRDQAGLNKFKISVKEFVAHTHAISLQAKTGRYGGTYAHKDIAFEFGSAISPIFKLYLLKEYQRLKDDENDRLKLEWTAKRFLSKNNYLIHTDAVKNYVLPQKNFAKSMEWLAYADEADLLNVALFGCTAKAWRDANPDIPKNYNIRDYASILELTVLSNLETHNAELLKEGMDKADRFDTLYKIAQYQLQVLMEAEKIKELPEVIEKRREIK